MGWLRERARGVVRRAMGGYRIQIVAPDSTRRERLDNERTVAVVGGGLAGITAAESLARRGFRVSLFEDRSEIGGKVGSEIALDPDGEPVRVDHGFHAFFRQYYNLESLLRRASLRPLRAIDDYVIAAADGTVSRFGEIEPAPLLNVLSLGARGFFRLGEVSRKRTRTRMHELLAYDLEHTFRELDDRSFAAFADEAGLPPRLRRIFATFGRAFFAEEHRLSAAELVKAFHFYYLSHDHGLVYDYLDGDADEMLVQPLRRHLEATGVRIRTSTVVRKLAATAEGILVDDQLFQHVVLATPAVASREIIDASPSLAIPDTAARLRRLERGARYAVLRVWLDRDPCAALPVFVSTDRVRLLDAVASCHRVTRADAAWAARRGGAVLELHSYAVPEDIDDAEIGAALYDEMARFFPAASSASVLGRHLAVRDDFTAHHVGLHAHRPATRTEDARLVLAGDWVALPVPALLMEGACTSGLYAANAIAETAGLSPETVWSVPLRGILASIAPH